MKNKTEGILNIKIFTNIKIFYKDTIIKQCAIDMIGKSMSGTEEKMKKQT